MTSYTMVDAEKCIGKLELAIRRADRGLNKDYANVDAAILKMAVSALRQQQARIAELESAQARMDAALREAAMPSGNTHQLPIGKNPPTLPPNVAAEVIA